jgi:hypothetical protein
VGATGINEPYVEVPSSGFRAKIIKQKQLIDPSKHVAKFEHLEMTVTVQNLIHEQIT